MQTKFLQTNSHLPVSHRCQTRLRSKLCTLLWVCRSRDNRARFSLKAGCVRPAQLVRWLDAGHACVKGLWNYQQLEHINQWESRDQRESPSFPFLLLLPFAWFSTKHDWTHWRKKMLHKFTIWLWFDVKRPKGNRGDFSKWGFFIDDWRQNRENLKSSISSKTPSWIGLLDADPDQSEITTSWIVKTWRTHCKPSTIGSRESWNYCLTDQENLGTTV